MTPIHSNMDPLPDPRLRSGGVDRSLRNWQGTSAAMSQRVPAPARIHRRDARADAMASSDRQGCQPLRRPPDRWSSLSASADMDVPQGDAANEKPVPRGDNPWRITPLTVSARGWARWMPLASTDAVRIDRRPAQRRSSRPPAPGTDRLGGLPNRRSTARATPPASCPALGRGDRSGRSHGSRGRQTNRSSSTCSPPRTRTSAPPTPGGHSLGCQVDNARGEHSGNHLCPLKGVDHLWMVGNCGTHSVDGKSAR